MNKQELITRISEKSGLSKTQANNALTAFELVVTEALANGDDVALVGFGTFKSKQQQSRIARNPKTGETIQVPAKKSPNL